MAPSRVLHTRHLVAFLTTCCVAARVFAAEATDTASCSSTTTDETALGVVPSVAYAALVNLTLDDTVTATVERAFGASGLGVLAVTDVPASLDALRVDMAAYSRALALLSPEVLAKYERGDLSYVVGWSRGREKFRGKLDVAKGSFYANGLYEDADASDEVKKRYPASSAEPTWPDRDVGADFRATFRGLARGLYDLSYHVLRHCDRLVDRALRSRLSRDRRPRRRKLEGNGSKGPWWTKRGLPGHFSFLRDNKVATAARRVFLNRRRHALTAVTHNHSRLHVARALHYYPMLSTVSEDSDDDWCGWHNDNSVLTALAPATYFDDATGDIVAPPPGAGLFVYPRGRDANPVQVRLRREDDDQQAASSSSSSSSSATPPHVLFQIGEAAQILSGGVLRATPHAVRPGRSHNKNNISRDTFALFVEPHWDFPLAPPPDVPLQAVFDDDDDDDRGEPVVPPLRKRLPRVPVEFAQFLADSVAEYY